MPMQPRPRADTLSLPRLRYCMALISVRMGVRGGAAVRVGVCGSAAQLTAIGAPAETPTRRPAGWLVRQTAPPSDPILFSSAFSSPVPSPPPPPPPISPPSTVLIQWEEPTSDLQSHS